MCGTIHNSFVVENREFDSVKQICVSACKDSEIPLEPVELNTLTLVCLFLLIQVGKIYHVFQAIVELLKANPKANLKDAMYAAR